MVEQTCRVAYYSYLNRLVQYRGQDYRRTIRDTARKVLPTVEAVCFRDGKTKATFNSQFELLV